MNKIESPKLLIRLENKKINNLSTLDKITDGEFKNDCLTSKITGAEFNGCVFKNVDFSKGMLNDVDVIDCVFDACDLSNISISAKLFLRVKFINCSLVGLNLVDSSVKDATFTGCNLKYANLSSKFKNVLFDTCNMQESRLFENEFNNVQISSCDLSGAEIFKTSLSKMDLSSSNLNDVSSDVQSIKEVTVDMTGALNLVRVLGINVKF